MSDKPSVADASCTATGLPASAAIGMTTAVPALFLPHVPVDEVVPRQRGVVTRVEFDRSRDDQVRHGELAHEPGR
jgi:hypothetical protein